MIATHYSWWEGHDNERHDLAFICCVHGRVFRAFVGFSFSHYNPPPQKRGGGPGGTIDIIEWGGGLKLGRY